MEFEYKNVLIYGYGQSGKAVERVLQNIGVGYRIYDKKIRIGGGVYELKLNRKTLSKYDLVVLSPGVSIFDKSVKLIRRMGIRLIGELEFGYMFTSARIIGVTGTNGKTSTVELITHILNTAGYKAQAFGNIGNPLSNIYGCTLDYAVCEISSFQLETIEKFKCDIAAIINIDKDHIDRHKTIKNYINCKLNIVKNSTPDTYVILNDDDAVCSNMKYNIQSKLLLTSKSHVVEGVYTKDSAMYYNNGVGISELFNVSKLKINLVYLDNVMCAVSVAKILGIDTDVIIKAIKTWRLPPHRLEFVTESGGIKYINDSKSTNVHSVQCAINSVNGNIILLLGGANKKLKFDCLISNLPKNIKGVVTFGASAKYLHKLCVKYGVNSYQTDSVEDAVKTAQSIAVTGDTILFSPGCTSFDCFTSYSERGEHYKQIVLESTYDQKD